MTDITLDTVLVHSPDVAVRRVGERVVLAPLHAEPGDPLDDLFTLNATGQAIWDLVDGERPVRAIVDALLGGFAVPRATLAHDVVGFLQQLLDKRMASLR